MEKIFGLILLSLSLSSFAQDIPTTPPNACYEGCTQTQQQLLNDFENLGVLPDQTPAVYSGVCNHLGMYAPDVDHYSVVLLDQHQGKWTFGSIFSFFAEQDDFADWDLEKAREEISPYWKEHSTLTSAANTARAVVRYADGNPAYIYWMRQNPVTKELYYITYAGRVMISFCRLNQHPK